MTLAEFCLALALVPLGMTLMNLLVFRTLSAAGAPPEAPLALAMSVLIPARNEALNIEAAVTAVLACRAPNLECVVLDDHSSDGTGEIVRRLAANDPRLRLVEAPELPPGWAGKQHACFVLGEAARHEALLFIDADVRLATDALPRLAKRFANRPKLALLSGFPEERTGSVVEHMLIPLIHLLLLGYLPMLMSRVINAPALAAGCGQLMLARRDAYRAIGGHGAVRASMHDGVTLPRAFRRGGHRTALFDAGDLASCRMYEGARATWAGFSKNATEGLARPIGLPVWTVLLGGGHVLPFLWLPFASAEDAVPLALACTASFGLRLLLAWRFRQSLIGALLHPAAIMLMLALQWNALVAAWRGRRVAWRGRSYEAVS